MGTPSTEVTEERRLRQRGEDMSPREIEDAIGSIRRRLDDIEGAFMVKNGKPDFAGHNYDHEYRAERDKTFNIYKVEATKKIIGALAGLVLIALGTGAIEHLKQLLGLH